MADEGTTGILDKAQLGEDHWTNDYDLDDGAKKILGKYESIDEALKGYVNASQLLGRSISLPKDDDKPEDKAKQYDSIYAKLGRPEKPDDYKIEKPAELPEGLQWSDEVAAEFKTIAHKLGLNQNQVELLVKFDTDRQIKQIKAAQEVNTQMQTQAETTQKEAVVKAGDALKAEWGVNFERNIKGVVQAFEVYGTPALLGLLKNKGIDNDPIILKTFYKIYEEKLAEGNLIKGFTQTEEPEDGILSYPSMKKK